jgi:hypothetical protein
MAKKAIKTPESRGKNTAQGKAARRLFSRVRRHPCGFSHRDGVPAPIQQAALLDIEDLPSIWTSLAGREFSPDHI